MVRVPLWTAFIHNLPQFKYVSVGETVIECHNLTPILFEYREKCVVQEDPSDPVIWIRFNQYQGECYPQLAIIPQFCRHSNFLSRQEEVLIGLKTG